MRKEQCVSFLTEHGIKPTANRIVIAETLASADCPMSVKELEYRILSIDKSNIFRTLMLFKEHHLVHVIEDGDGGLKYELCLSHDHKVDEDEHLHFFCERCHKTICLHEIPVPMISLPTGYELRGISCVVKGLCPKCRKQ